MSRPLRVKYTSAGVSDGLIEMSVLDISDVMVPLILSKVNDSDGFGRYYNTALSINSTNNSYTAIGSATDTRSDAVGTHPASNTVINTYTLYQENVTDFELVLTPSAYPCCYEQVNGITKVRPMTNNEILTYIAQPVLNTLVGGGQGIYFLGLTSSGAPATGTWVSAGTMNDTYYVNSTLTTEEYTLWRRVDDGVVGALITPTNTSKPVKQTVVGSETRITEMTDSEIEELALFVRRYINSTGIGKYLFQTNNPAFTVGGTWVNKGSFVNKANVLQDTSYEGVYAGSFSGTYTQNFTPSSVGIFNQVFSRDFTGPYEGTYTGTYSAFYQTGYSGVFIGSYSSVYQGTYVGVFSFPYSGEFTGDFNTTYAGNFAGSYQTSYTGTFSGAYTGDYTGSYSSDYNTAYTQDYSGNYTGDYSRLFSGNYSGLFTGAFSGDYTNSFTNIFTSQFTEAYIGNYALIYSGSWTNNFSQDYSGLQSYSGNIYTATGSIIFNRLAFYSRLFSGAYSRVFTNSFSPNFTSEYQGTFTPPANVINFSGTFTGLYSISGIYTGSYASSYSGTVLYYEIGVVFYTGAISWTRTFNNTYTRVFERTYTSLDEPFIGFWTPTPQEFYGGNFIGSWTRGFTGTKEYTSLGPVVYYAYTQNFSVFYTGSYGIGFFSGNYGSVTYSKIYQAYYSRLFTGSYSLNYVGTYSRIFIQGFSGTYGEFSAFYVGFFTGGYTGNYVYTRLFTRAYTGLNELSFSKFESWTAGGSDSYDISDAFTGPKIFNVTYTGAVANYTSANYTNAFALETYTPDENPFTLSFTSVYTSAAGTFTRVYKSNDTYTPTYSNSITYTATFTQTTFTGVFTNTFSNNYTKAIYTGEYNSVFTGSFTNTFTKTFSGTFNQNYTGTFAGSFADTFSRDYTGIYSTNYTKAYSGLYSGTYKTAYTGAYSKLFTKDYTGNYSGNYTRAYSGIYSKLFTAAYSKNFSGSYTSAYSGTYGNTFTEDYSGIYSGTYIGSFGGTYTGLFTGQFSGLYTAGFTGIYSLAYSGSFANNFTGNYSGLTVLNTTSSTTYTLWVRTA